MDTEYSAVMVLKQDIKPARACAVRIGPYIVQKRLGMVMEWPNVGVAQHWRPGNKSHLERARLDLTESAISVDSHAVGR